MLEFDTMKTNQSSLIQEAILKHMDNGTTDMGEIYTLIVDELSVPRPTVRRVARDLRLDLMRKIEILERQLKPLTVTC